MLFCMKHRGWIFVSGLIWLCIGVFLLSKGMKYTSEISWMIAGLVLGLLKSYFVLSKTARRVAKRIQSLPLPIRIKDVYGPSYFILVGLMVSLGFVLRYFPDNLHGMIDIAAGVAL